MVRLGAGERDTAFLRAGKFPPLGFFVLKLVLLEWREGKHRDIIGKFFTWLYSSGSRGEYDNQHRRG